MKLFSRIKSVPRKHTSAFTLPEVVAASAILSVCAAGIMAAFTYGFRVTRMTQENQRATQVLIEASEIVRLYSWDQLHTPGFVPTNFTEYYDPNAQRGVVYHGTLTMTDAPEDIPASYRDDIKFLTVTIHWTTDGVPRERSLTTLIAKDGVQNYVY